LKEECDDVPADAPQHIDEFLADMEKLGSLVLKEHKSLIVLLV